MSKYIDAGMLEKDGWNIQRIRRASLTEMIYETKKPTDFPAADVEPVRHGRWEDVEHAPNGLLYATCSVCGKRRTIESVNYCGECGARMEASE